MAKINTRWTEDHQDGERKHFRLLKQDYIPAFTVCPFSDICEQKKAGRCFHYGETHSVPFLCRSAKTYNEDTR